MQREYLFRHQRRRHTSSTLPAGSSKGKLNLEPQVFPIKESDNEMAARGNNQEVSSGSKKNKTEEEIEIPVIKMQDFSSVNTDEKLNLIMVAINKINTNFHHKFDEMNEKLFTAPDALEKRLSTCEKAVLECKDILEDETEGLVPRFKDVEDNIEDLRGRMDILEEEKSAMLDEIYTLKGFSQVYDKKLGQIDSKVVDLTARSMQNNIIIGGIKESAEPRESCKKKVLEFFRDKMKMEVKDKEVLVAHRLGKINNNNTKPRSIVVRCAHSLRERIFSFTKNLKDVKTEDGDAYNVSPQLPEPLLTQRIERRQKINKTKKLNETLDDAKKIKMEFKGGELYLNGKAERKHVTPPSASDIFNITYATQQKMEAIKMEQSSEIKDKSSVF